MVGLLNPPIIALGSPEWRRDFAVQVNAGMVSGRSPNQRILGPNSAFLGWQFTDDDLYVESGWASTLSGMPLDHLRRWCQDLVCKFGPDDFLKAHARLIAEGLLPPEVTL